MDIDSLWLVMGRMGAVARQPNIELLLLDEVSGVAVGFVCLQIKEIGEITPV